MAIQSVRIQFISEGFRQILLSEGTKQVVEQTAEEIKDRANANYGGDGFQANVIVGAYGGGRYVGFVNATDKWSLKAESEDKALTGAIT